MHNAAACELADILNHKLSIGYMHGIKSCMHQGGGKECWAAGGWSLLH